LAPLRLGVTTALVRGRASLRVVLASKAVTAMRQRTTREPVGSPRPRDQISRGRTGARGWVNGRPRCDRVPKLEAARWCPG
jgi:hypothetical protein